MTQRPSIIENVVIRADIDPYLSLKALSAHSGLSVRTLRKALTETVHPLPHYRLSGKILVRRSEFDRWMAQFRQEGAELDQIVSQIAKEVA
ncbi:MAG TPA: helix-turn-helix domain-containing protein [Nitrospiraceae bacterium]|nr:helix-turn-helix domain-containing protein [Nitrospiraceae bacterium]